MRAVVTGGGTGGHIFPALAVAAALIAEDPGCEVRYIGGVRGMEAQILPGTGIPYHLVTSKKLRKTLSFGTVGALLALARGYREAAAYLKFFAPDVVISTGGYTAAATTLAAAKRKIPTIIQEYNAVPGRTNLKLAKWATKICVWFEETARAFPGKAVVRTGVPLRGGIVSSLDSAAARRKLGLDPALFTVLVLGGSQGAKFLNQRVLDVACTLGTSIQILHQTGANNFEEVKAKAAELELQPETYNLRPFLDSDEVPLAYASADLLICRCGISTLAEACVNGVPMIMVPLPTAYADHQTENAKVVEKHEAGLHMPEQALAAPFLLDNWITNLAESTDRLAKMGRAAKRVSRPNAATDVAKLAIELASGAK